MERGLAEAQFVSALKDAGLARGESHGIVNHCSVNRVQIFNQKRLAFAPDARVAARDLRLRVKFREINFGEDVRLRVAPAQQVTLLLQDERNVQLRSSRNDQLGGRTRRTQRRA